MALDTIIIDGDQAIFEAAMGDANVVVRPGIIIASGKTTIQGTAVCIAGDEKSVEVAGCFYTTKEHLVPGVGTLKITALSGDQLTTKSNSGKKAFILQGSQFEAEFVVDGPAHDIKPVASGGAPIPDSEASYPGKGQLIPANQKIQAT